MSALKVKEDILKQASNSSGNHLVIFDIDSSLFNVSYRTQAIFNHLAKQIEFQSKYPHLFEQLIDLEVRPSDWGFRDIIKRTGIEANLEFFEELRNHWVKGFFSSDFLQYDQQYPGASDYVTDFLNTTTIKYLTGRDHKNMYAGTVDSLVSNAFPFEEQHLHMKPHSRRADEDFKVEKLKDLHAQYDSIWFFENEPVIINKVIKENLPTHLIFVDSVHSNKESVEDNILKIKADFTL